jgi:hypothetical protein
VVLALAVAAAVLLPDDEHAASPAASASTAVKAARFFISPLLVSIQPLPERLTISRTGAGQVLLRLLDFLAYLAAQGASIEAETDTSALRPALASLDLLLVVPITPETEQVLPGRRCYGSGRT